MGTIGFSQRRAYHHCRLVTDSRCRPPHGSLIEIWHADENGDYDCQGYRLRGHQFTDEPGCWWFNTVMPALYPGRTRHFHFRVQRPGGAILTTQLFFLGEPDNAHDWLFDDTLLIAMIETGDGRFGRFDFVLTIRCEGLIERVVGVLRAHDFGQPSHRLDDLFV